MVNGRQRKKVKKNKEKTNNKIYYENELTDQRIKVIFF